MGTYAANDSQNPSTNVSNVNVGRTERWFSLLAGILLGGVGLRMASEGKLPALLLTILGADLVYRGATGNCHVYTALGVTTAVKTNKHKVSVPHEQGIHVERYVTVYRPIEEVYTFWRDFENLPRFMQHLESVEVLDDKRSHWVAKAPAGLSVSWDAEIINEVPNEVIGWRSLPDAQIANAGAVRFKNAENGMGTEVHVNLEYVPPAGNIGVAFAKLLGEEPSIQVQDDLRRFKQLLEAGEIPTTDGQPRGK